MTFILMLGLAFTVVAIVAAIACVWRGLQGVPVLTSPQCRVCGCDLRGFGSEPLTCCTECGADLRRPSAVRFGRYERQWLPVALGGLLIVAVAAVLAMLFDVRIGPKGGLVRAAPPVVVQNVGWPMGLPPTPARPHADTTLYGLQAEIETNPFGESLWNELEHRRSAGQLPPSDAKAIVDRFSDMASGTGRAPRSMAAFAQGLLAGGHLDTAAFSRFAHAVHGDRTDLRVRRVVRRGYPAMIEFGYGKPDALPPLDFVFALRDVRVDGGTVTVNGDGDTFRPDRLSARYGRALGFMRVDAPPGPHVLTFLFDAALLTPGTLTTHDLPGQATNWPTPLARWMVATPLTVEVSDKPGSEIELVTDPTFDPQRPQGPYKRPAVEMPIVTLRETRDGPSLLVEVPLGFSPVAQAYDVTVTAGEKSYSCGKVGMLADHAAPSGGVGPAKELSNDVTTCTVVLTPDPTQIMNDGRIWGRPVTFTNVPIHRPTTPTRP